MKTVLMTLFYKPGTSHIQSLENRAIAGMNLGVVSAMPQIEVRESESVPGFWQFVITVKEEDWPFWIGFWMGKDFTINNREIAAGVK